MLYWSELPPDLDEQRERWRGVLGGDAREVRTGLRRLRWTGVPHPLQPGRAKRNAGIWDALDDVGFGVCELHAGDRFAVAGRVAAAHGLRSRALVDDLASYLASGIFTRLDLRKARSVEDLAEGRSRGIDWGLEAWARDVCLDKPLWPFVLDLDLADGPGELQALLRRKRLTERIGQPWKLRFYEPVRTQEALDAAGAEYRDAVARRVEELRA